jgi:hypothetical protein
VRNPLLRNIIRLLPIFGLIVLGVWLLGRPGKLTQESSAARGAQADLLGLQGAERDSFVSGSEVENENEILLSTGDYWATRYTYPTFQFDQRWWLEAADQDGKVAQGIPAGQVVYRAENSASGLILDPSQWTSLGPEPMVGQSWGNVAGRASVIISDPVSPTIAYLGSDGGGVWKTTNCCDSNTTWEVTTDDPLIDASSIGDLLFDPNDHNTIYAGTGDLRYGSFAFGSAGLLKSTDAGATWVVLGVDEFAPPYPQPAGEFPQYQAIGKVQVDPRDSDNVIVGTKTGLYFSYDAGANWTGPCLTNGHTDQRQDMTGLLVNDNGASTDLYAAVGTRGFATPVQTDLDNTGANAVYKTTIPASGCPASWTLLNSGWPAGTGDGNPANDQIGRIDLAISPSNPDYIYAQVADNTNPSGTLGVWRTTDGGTTWTQRAVRADFLGCGGGVGQTWYNAGMVVDPNNPDNVFLSMIDVYRSTNGGDTFTNLTNGYCGGNVVHVDQHGRAFVGGSSDTLLVSGDGGANVTHNATATTPTWTQLNDTLSTIEFYGGDITANFATAANPGVAGGAQDNGSAAFVYSGEPGSAAWIHIKGGDGFFSRIEPILEERWYQESQWGAMSVTTAGPFSGQQSINPGWSADRISFIFPYELYKHDCSPTEGCNHLVGGTHRIWETIEGGRPSNTWYTNSPDLTKGTLEGRSHINQLQFAVTDETIVIVGTNDGNVQYGFDLGQGVPESATWVNVTGGNAVLPNRPVLDVATDPVDALVGYAAVGGFDQNTPSTPGHVFRVTCTADCASFDWENKSGNLPNIPVDSIVANPNFPQQVFAGTDWGVYYTDDINESSPTWYRFENGLPSVMIWDMVVDPGFTTLAAFTRSRGAYVWPLPSSPVNPVDYFVALQPNTNVDAVPGSTVIHDFTLSNLGLLDDSYDLSLDGFSWPTTLLTSSPITLTAGLTVTVSVEVEVPNTLGISDSFTVMATSVNSPTVSATATGSTNSVVNPDITATPDTTALSGLPGDVLTYTINVENSGDYTDTFAVDFSGNSWSTSLSTSSIGPLAVGASADVEVYVVVGSAGSEDLVSITFTSDLDNGVTASVDLTSTRESFDLFLPVIIKPQ